ncbi:MAG: hypothetical protein ACD_15C00237G0004 [uncultured bacterium]|nr:MAG: hypothetical protein ACD_15C00237G0004 [uncultured bacterium]
MIKNSGYFKKADLSLNKGGIMKVLMVNDDELTLALMSRIVTKKGHQAVCFFNGKSAIEEYRRNFEKGESYDLIVMDLDMPDEMGHEVARKLLAINPLARIILASTSDRHDVFKNFEKYGFLTAVHGNDGFEAAMNMHL